MTIAGQKTRSRMQSFGMRDRRGGRGSVCVSCEHIILLHMMIAYHMERFPDPSVPVIT